MPLSDAVKNVILFVIFLAIVHFYLRGILQNQAASDASGQAMSRRKRDIQDPQDLVGEMAREINLANFPIDDDVSYKTQNQNQNQLDKSSASSHASNISAAAAATKSSSTLTSAAKDDDDLASYVFGASAVVGGEAFGAPIVDIHLTNNQGGRGDDGSDLMAATFGFLDGSVPDVKGNNMCGMSMDSGGFLAGFDSAQSFSKCQL